MVLKSDDMFQVRLFQILVQSIEPLLGWQQIFWFEMPRRKTITPLDLFLSWLQVEQILVLKLKIHSWWCASTATKCKNQKIVFSFDGSSFKMFLAVNSVHNNSSTASSLTTSSLLVRQKSLTCSTIGTIPFSCRFLLVSVHSLRLSILGPSSSHLSSINASVTTLRTSL